MKDVTGYNLNQLFVGSEGTLGVITEIILRLIPKPQSRLTAMAIFPLLEDATKTVANLLGAGILPSTIEIMDNTTIRVVEEYLQMGLPVEAGAILIIEVDGKVESIRPEIEQVGEVCAKSGASDVKVATTEEESEALWKARRAVSPALGRLAPTKQGEDISSHGVLSQSSCAGWEISRSTISSSLFSAMRVTVTSTPTCCLIREIRK